METGAWPGPWTASSRPALDQAGEEAGSLGHDYLGSEHVLLALVSRDHDTGGEVLRALGITRERVLSTSAGWRRGLGRRVRLRMPRLKQALEHAQRIAAGLDRHLADTSHAQEIDINRGAGRGWTHRVLLAHRAALVAAGLRASRHSGQPSRSRRALRPSARSCRTASCA